MAVCVCDTYKSVQIDKSPGSRAYFTCLIFFFLCAIFNQLLRVMKNIGELYYVQIIAGRQCADSLQATETPTTQLGICLFGMKRCAYVLIQDMPFKLIQRKLRKTALSCPPSNFITNILIHSLNGSRCHGEKAFNLVANYTLFVLLSTTRLESQRMC